MLSETLTTKTNLTPKERGLAPNPFPEGKGSGDWQNNFIEWLSETSNYKGMTRSALTVAAYRQDMAHFCGWFERINGEAFAPGLMNSLDARQYRTWCLDVEKCRPATWNRRRATLSVLCQWIEEELEIKIFKFKRQVGRIKETQAAAPHWLEQPDERKLMRQAEINLIAARTNQQRTRALRDWAMLSVMRFAGLRVAEVAALDVEDVKLTPRTGELKVRAGKGDKERDVELSSSVRNVLAVWLSERGAQAGALFVDKDGQGITRRAIQKRVEALGEQCGLKVSCHMLRHTCAKRMVDGGASLAAVKQQMGHERIDTTVRYTQAGKEDLRAAAEAGEMGFYGKGN